MPSDYASLASLVPDTHGFTVFTSSIPEVWTGSDHLSITWCDQFRKVLVRAIMDVVDVNRPGQTKPRAHRMNVFKKRLLTGMERVAERSLPDQEPTTLLTLEDNSNSILAAGERLVLRGLGTTGRPKAHMLPLPPHAGPGAVRFNLLSNQPLDSTGAAGTLEVLFCSVFPLHHGHSASLFSMNMDLSGSTTGSTRLACKNAAADVIKLPASTPASVHPFDDAPPFFYLQFDAEQLAEHQFVAVVDKGQRADDAWVVAEFADLGHSVIHADLGLRRLLASGLHVTLPAGRPTVTEIRVPAVYSSLLAYKLKLRSHPCGDGGAELFTPLLRQYLSEPFESRFFVNVKEADISLHGIAPFMPPALRAHAVTDGLALQVWSDPTCGSPIDVDLRVDVFGSLGKLYMRYRTVFPAIPLVIVALVLRKQFMVHDQAGIFMPFAEALDLCLRSSLPVLLLAMTLLGISLAASSSHPTGSTSAGPLSWKRNSSETTIDYTKNDMLLGSQDPFFWFLMPLCGLLCVGICLAVSHLALLLVHVCTFAASSLAALAACLRHEELRRGLGPAFASSSPRRRLVVTSVLLLLVSTIIPYQLAYMVACVVQVATCTRALRVARETRSGAHWSFFNYAHAVLVLMLWVLPINAPVLIVWWHNLAVHWLTPFSSHHNVLSIMPFILLVETLTGGKMLPRLSTR